MDATEMLTEMETACAALVAIVQGRQEGIKGVCAIRRELEDQVDYLGELIDAWLSGEVRCTLRGYQVVIRVCEPDVRALLLALRGLTQELRATGAGDGGEVRGEH